jgi:hypothetical protein
MRNHMTRWAATLAAGICALAVWGIAAGHGHGWELIWLPAVVLGAAWPRSALRSRCFAARSSRDGKS